MPGTNIAMLQTVANGLGDLKDDMVFVGGAVAELYANNPELSDIRPTLDVDCVIELSSKTSHAKLESALPYGSEEEATEIIKELIQNIADIE